MTFIQALLVREPDHRPSARAVLAHAWLTPLDEATILAKRAPAIMPCTLQEASVATYTSERPVTSEPIASELPVASAHADEAAAGGAGVLDGWGPSTIHAPVETCDNEHKRSHLLAVFQSGRRVSSGSFKKPKGEASVLAPSSHSLPANFKVRERIGHVRVNAELATKIAEAARHTL